MQLTVVERKALTVMGLHIRTRPMSPEIQALWPRFVSRIPEIERPSEPGVTYGVMRHEVGDMAQLDYWAAVAVASPDHAPRGMNSLVLPAGHYARFAFPFSGLADGFGQIFDRLLPSSNYLQQSGPYFERYDEDFDPNDGQSKVEVYVPVQRR